MRNFITQNIGWVFSGIGIFLAILIWRFIQQCRKSLRKHYNFITTEYEVKTEKEYPCKNYEEAMLGFGGERIERESTALIEKKIHYFEGLWYRKICPFLNRIKNKNRGNKEK